MRECDLIMKGGITSGVVYPHAIAEIATEYRLRDIGGASAGAIGAAMAAAAEYRRQTTPAGSDPNVGFDETRRLADELASGMRSKFQPSQTLAPLFGILMRILERPNGQSIYRAALFGITHAYWHGALIGASIALAGLVLASSVGSLALATLGVVVGGLVAVGLIAIALFRAVIVDLPAEDYGVCPGIGTAFGEGKAGLTDWMADRIDQIAGKIGVNGALGDPLTVGELRRDAGVRIATMTTDLSSGRPYQLPLQDNLHYFSKQEFEEIFPKRVVDYLVREGGKVRLRGDNLPDDIHRLPTGDRFPILLAARMSLSFPGLIRAVGLYRLDYGIKDKNGDAAVRRCLFSDGGISSNFPIHMFDALLPSRPTFGIALTGWNQERHGRERVHMPDMPKQSTSLPARPIYGLAGFLGAILNTAKDWQDTLQSLLPGYAERIVEVRLDDGKEGGMNLNMSEETIRTLSEYGRQAGQMVKSNFCFDEHRYRRALSLFDSMNDALTGLSESYRAPPDGDPTEMIYADVLTDYKPKRYSNTVAWRRDVLRDFAKRLAAIAVERIEVQSTGFGAGDVPAADASIRLVADAERRPRRVEP